MALVPLQFAVRVELVGMLMDAGAKLQAVDLEGRTPLHWACQEGNVKSVELLLQRGADATVVDAQKRTPAQLAKLRKKTAVVAALQQHAKATAAAKSKPAS